LLRLTIPLNAMAYSIFHLACASNPENSPKHSIGMSDGRCVQRAGTYSACVNDTCLQEIPRSRSKITKIYP